MLKGLALTPPTIGRIAIGKVVERNGKRLPEKDDEFTLTSQVQHKNGWVLHPLDRVLRLRLSQASSSAGLGNPSDKEASTPEVKLRSVPVRMLFNDPDLNLRASYSLFDRHTGRPQCVGNGESCKRAVNGSIQTLPCPSPAACGLALEGPCKPYGRLNVHVVPVDRSVPEEPPTDTQATGDELSSFVFRTTGFNSIRTLAARLKYFHAVSGGHLATMPLELKLRGKSTTMSHRTPIYYVDLVIQSGLTLSEAILEANTLAEERFRCGYNQTALDDAARAGLAYGAFEESEEEGVSVVEEFYPDTGDASLDAELRREGPAHPRRHVATGAKQPLGQKLEAQLDALCTSIQSTSDSGLLNGGKLNHGDG